MTGNARRKQRSNSIAGSSHVARGIYCTRDVVVELESPTRRDRQWGLELALHIALVHERTNRLRGSVEERTSEIEPEFPVPSP